MSQNESVIGLSLTIVQAVRYGGKSDWELVRHVWNRDRRGPLAKHALNALGESQGDAYHEHSERSGSDG